MRWRGGEEGEMRVLMVRRWRARKERLFSAEMYRVSRRDVQMMGCVGMGWANERRECVDWAGI